MKLIKKLVLVMTLVFTMLLSFACGSEVKLTFEKSNYELKVGESFELKPVVTGSESLVEYSFDKEGIVEKNENTIVAKAVGEVVITASLKDVEGISATIKVVVKAEEHTHVYDKEVVEDKYLKSNATTESAAVYYKSCECGEFDKELSETFEHGDKLTEEHKHAYDQEVVDSKYLKSNATCTERAVYYKSCSCGEFNKELSETFNAGNLADHVYDKEVAEEKYLAEAATTEAPAKYYKSCVCGEFDKKLSGTFEYGDKLPVVHTHAYDQEVVDDKYLAEEATCTQKAKYYKSCSCGEFDKAETFEAGDLADHVYDKEVAEEKYLKSVATTESAAIYYKSCSCGAFDKDASETFEYGDKLTQAAKVEYVLNGGSWTWEQPTVTAPKNGIDAVSNLPELFMADFYYYLVVNNLQNAETVMASAREKAQSWDLFTQKWSDPVAIYNNNSTGKYSTNDGFAQFFWDSLTNGNPVGGFFGTSPYKEKYANLFAMVYEMMMIAYPTIEEANKEQGFAFVFDGYFYGTQGLKANTFTNYEIFNSGRESIPTPTIGYVSGEKVENTYEIYDVNGTVKLVAPVKEGYAFVGWYLTEDLSGNPVNEVSSGCKVYAKWHDLNAKAPTHKINYNLDGGTLPQDAKAEYTEGISFVLPIPTKDGFVFLGWKLDGSNDYITEISASSKADVTVNACWDVQSGNIIISYSYDAGNLPTKIADNVNELIEKFWNDFYKWSGSSKSLDTFKAEHIAKWKTGAAGEYKVYMSGGANAVDEGYFVHAKANSDWNAWMIVFDQMVTNINGSQSAFGSTYVGYLRLYTFVTQSSASQWNVTRNQTLMDAMPVSIPLVTEFEAGQSIDLVNLVIDDGRTFLGWYDNNDKKITNTNQITSNVTLVAKWSDSTPVETFNLTNKIDKLERLNSHKLTWAFTPSNATNKYLKFKSSNTSILTIDEEGNMFGLKDGKVTVTVEVMDNAALNVSFEVEVFINSFIDVSYNTTSVVKVNDVVKVTPKLYGPGTAKYLYKSLDSDIADINDAGEITGKSSGYARFEVYLEGNENVKSVFGVTVLSEEDYNLYEIIVKAHNSEVYVVRDLLVAYEYKVDVYGSVSDLLFNEPYTVNTEFEAKQAENGSNHGGRKASTEFICVHYTAGTAAGSTARANASYFANQTSSSIHYTTGNDGIYHVLDDDLVGWHAGDGTGTTFRWINTGVKATENVKPVWGAVKDSNSSTGYYFSLNGQATTIPVPMTGTRSNGSSATLADPNKAFTYFGPAWKVVDGTYYMGTTWVCFTQVAAGAISSRGGNNNSVGIETACNKGSDLWLTYQYTAELVARLMDKYSLDLTRVVGHNMFSGKDCPQTLLANGGELWVKFMECVDAEHQLYTKMTKNGKYKISAVSHNTEVVKDNGRVTNIPNYSTNVTYTVTITDTTTNTSKDITFSTIIHGTYTE